MSQLLELRGFATTLHLRGFRIGITPTGISHQFIEETFSKGYVRGALSKGSK